MSDNIRRFVWPKRVVVPRNARSVEIPVPSSGVRVVSDLIPTECVTDTFPAIGVDTYGSIDFMNKSENPETFAGYICKKAERDWRHPDFTRLFFIPDLSATSNVPFKTEWSTKIHNWHPILEKITFLDDPYLKVPVQTGSGTIYVPRVYVTWEYRAGVTDVSKVREQYFLASTPFNKSNSSFPVPQPRDISWDLGVLGNSGSMGSCLGPGVKVRAANPQQGLGGGPYHEIYPPSNVQTWESYNIDFTSTTILDVLYMGVLRTVYPPDLTPITKKKF